jgi:pimeloyl-ACP methyl ester carboxylesterase/DNA-binding SARP family transcriptional activator
VAAVPDVPPIHFAPARGARLAYQQWGSGSEVVVAIPPTAQNIDVCWEYPAIRAMLERFGSFCRYLHFDKRGTGCSDRRSRVADMDERVDDLRAVMDHAQVGRAHLLGPSEGGPMALLFAATYPERVASLCLFGSGPAIHTARTDAELEWRREVHRQHAAVWGTPDSRVAEGFAPSLAAADPGFVTWHQRYERLAASRDSLEDLLELTLHLDVREVLPEVTAPTLVVHRTGDRVVPIELGYEAAERIPHARLVEQSGDDHFGYAGDVDAWMDEFERFVTGEVVSTRISMARPPRVHVRTLGQFAVEVDGAEVPVSAWGSRRARQLCKRLVAARGWPVTRDELFDLLWPDETDRARLGARLSVQLSAVRRVLRGGVVADRESVRLDLGTVTTDLEVLLAADDDREVVAAWTGPFLPEDRYETWADGVRADAQARFVRSARRLAEQSLADDDTERARDLALRVLEVDPYDEVAHRLRVTSLLRSGARGRAQHAHDEWTRAMDELGLPTPELDSLQAMDVEPDG